MTDKLRLYILMGGQIRDILQEDEPFDLEMSERNMLIPAIVRVTKSRKLEERTYEIEIVEMLPDRDEPSITLKIMAYSLRDACDVFAATVRKFREIQ